MSGKKKLAQDHVLTKAYILGNGSIVSSEDLLKTDVMRGKLTPLSKSATSSVASPTPTQFSSVGKVGDPAGSAESYIGQLVEPPYDPLILAKFVEADEINFRCVKVKVSDALCRSWEVGFLTPDDDKKIGKKILEEEVEIVKSFMASCNRIEKFAGIFEKAGMDFESIGWGAIEVVRSADKQIRKLNHIPAHRIRVIEGWQGFAEVDNSGGYTFYQNYGDKVVSSTRKLADGTPETFDIVEDHDWSNAQWNLRDRTSFEPIASDQISKGCNELVYIPKFHPKSVYYGVPDFIPAIGYILGNINIRDFLLQYFDHNTVPQYAVIIKGADLDNGTKELIMTYFNSHVKGSSHKTLVIPIPGVAGDVDVQFQRLENVANMGAYEATRKANQVAIMVAHGVNPAIIGINEGGELGSGKGTSQMENYRERIIQPSQKRWASEINNLFRTGLGVQHVGVIFDQLDTDSWMEVLKMDITTMEKGLLTMNQVRQRNRLGPPVEGCDRAFIMSGAGPIFVDQLNAPQDTNEGVQHLGEGLDAIRGKLAMGGENVVPSSSVTQLV